MTSKFIIAFIIAFVITAIAGYIDKKKGIIPDILWIMNIMSAVIIYKTELIKNGNLTKAFVTFIVLLLIAVITNKIGGGDVKYIPTLILLLGEVGYIIVAIGLIVQILYAMARSRFTGEQWLLIKLPLAPYLFIGMATTTILLLTNKNILF